MKTRFQPSRKVTKKRPLSDSQPDHEPQPQPQTNIQPEYQSSSDLDPEVQQSNSQLSKTLSIAYNPKEILCRQSEKEVITKFVKSCMTSDGEEAARVLYISGVPGIGKTISTLQIIKKLKKHISPKKATFPYINSLSLAQPSQIYTSLNKCLYKPPKNDLRKNPALKLLLKIQEDPRVKIVVIDQVDFLYTRNQNILYNLFEWSNMRDTRFCVIVIANTMDFPEKLMPKLVSRMGNNRLVFKPYSQAEAQKIVEDRLMKSNRFSKDAIKYACMKMSSFTSDVRKLLDILRRSLQLKPTGTITLQDMNSTWRKYNEESGEQWQEYLPQFYRTIMNIIKDHGGVSTNYKIYQRMCVMGKYLLGEIGVVLREMEEMGIVRMKWKCKGVVRVIEVTLLKI